MRVDEQGAFKAVADPTRRAIIDLLAASELSSGAVAEHFAMSRPAVAKHLRVLRNSGLVAVRREGRQKINRLEHNGLKVIADWTAHYEKFWDQKLGQLKSKVEAGVGARGKDRG